MDKKNSKFNSLIALITVATIATCSPKPEYPGLQQLCGFNLDKIGETSRAEYDKATGTYDITGDGIEDMIVVDYINKNVILCEEGEDKFPNISDSNIVSKTYLPKGIIGKAERGAKPWTHIRKDEDGKIELLIRHNEKVFVYRLNKQRE